MKTKCPDCNKEIDGSWMGCCHYYPDCSMGHNPKKPCKMCGFKK